MILSRGGAVYGCVLNDELKAVHIRATDKATRDAWGIKKALPEFNDNTGVSLVLVHTEKGRELLDAICNDCEVRKLPLEKMLQPNLLRPSSPKGNREKFWAEYRSGGIAALVQTYGKLPLKKTNKSIFEIQTEKAFAVGEILSALKMIQNGKQMKTIDKSFGRFFAGYKKIPTAARAGIWFVICTVLQKCIGFITTPIFTRLMSAEEYGLYSTYLSWHGILTAFCTLKIYGVVYVNNYTRADTTEEKEAAALPLLSLSTVLTLLIFLIFAVLYPFVKTFIGLPFEMVCLIFAQILFETPVFFWTMKQRFEYRYIALVIVTLTIILLNAGLGVLFVYLADSSQSTARALSAVLVQLFFGGAIYVFFQKQAGAVFSSKGWKHALSVQLPLVPHSLSLTVLSSSDRIMILDLVGAAEAGIYSVGYSVGVVINFLKNSIVDALKPWMYQKIKETDYNSIRKTVNILMVLVTLASVLLTAFAPELVHIMAPARYYDAVYAIPPVAASSFFTFLYNIFSIAGMYYEKTKKIMAASISAAALNIALNALTIPRFGYISAAYTTLLSYMFLALAHYLIMRSVCKSYMGGAVIYDMKFILMMSLIVLASVIVLTFTYKAPVIRYLLILVLAVAAYSRRKTFIDVFDNIRAKKTKTEAVK
ncbi:MAG: lipopolysaccharide biosynthesis protein [Eubacteriales bacterium]|nr:lipopolysaccharide biosynthesis protein [Eubacteriales bacterium]